MRVISNDRRARINLWLADKQHDWWIDRGKVAEFFGTLQIHLFETPARWLLCHLFGHKPIADQCNKPEHDYCVWCERRMPWAALRDGGQ